MNENLNDKLEELPEEPLEETAAAAPEAAESPAPEAPAEDSPEALADEIAAAIAQSMSPVEPDPAPAQTDSDATIVFSQGDLPDPIHTAPVHAEPEIPPYLHEEPETEDYAEEEGGGSRKLLMILGLVLAIVVAAALAFGVYRHTVTVRYDNLMNEGEAYFQKSDYEKALSKYEAAYRTKDTDEAAIALAETWSAIGAAARFPYKKSY